MRELLPGSDQRFAMASKVILSFNGFISLDFTETEETLHSERTWNQMEGISDEYVLNSWHSEQF